MIKYRKFNKKFKQQIINHKRNSVKIKKQILYISLYSGNS